MGGRDELCGRTEGELVLRERIGEGAYGAVYRCEPRHPSPDGHAATSSV